MHSLLLRSSQILFACGLLWYCYKICRNVSKKPDVKDLLRPANTSWLIWALAATATVILRHNDHSLTRHAVSLMLGLWVVMILAACSGKGFLPASHLVYIVGCIVALTAVVIVPLFEPVLMPAVIILASIPTFQTAVMNTESESGGTWLFFLLSLLFALIDIPHWTFSEASIPVTMAAVSFLMVVILSPEPPQWADIIEDDDID
jgi:hypothetical protein